MFAIMVAILLAVLPVFAFAQPAPGGIVSCDGVDCGVCDIAQTGQNILNTGVYLAVFFSAILFAYAGWKYMTAGSEHGKSEGKEIFTNVMIGFVIILAGWLLIDTIMKSLVKEDGGFGPWNTICGPELDAAGRIRGGI